MNSVDRPGTPWWSLPGGAALDDFHTAREGLSRNEAARRLQEVGPNAPAPRKDEPWYEELLEEFTEPLILLLLAVGVLYAIFGEPSDAVVIVVVIAITIGAEFGTEWRAKRAIAALASLREPTAPVLRDGEIATVAVETIVPGDVVLLAAGDRVPADVRLLTSTALAIDESILTGESVASEKRADAAVFADAPLAERVSMAYGGTVVTRGDGTGVVVATGANTKTARIAHLVASTGPRRTPLQQKMGRLAGMLLWVALGASVLVPVLMVLIVDSSWRDALLSGLTLAFATIPEELPLLITSVLALGSFRLARRHAVVRNLQAAESLGAISVLVSDKTGTLTENRMTIGSIIDAGGEHHSLDGDDALVRRVLGIGILANDAVSATWGDPTDRAFLTAGAALGVGPETYRSEQRGLTVFPFSDATRSVAAAYQDGNQTRVAVKGAPEAVIARCTRVATQEGDLLLDPARRLAILAEADRLAAEGGRVLLVADRFADLADDAPRDRVESDLTCVGLVVLRDPVRPSAGPAVRELGEAGVRVVMITGDHPATAGAIGRELGLGSEAAVSEVDLPASMSTVEGKNLLAPFVLSHPVFARATPEGKFRIVDALEESGERVAVIGDGINDAPALARANVGVAMGMAGTDVAREASDLVLADDNFATVVVAVREGRHLYDNLRKAIRFYLAVKLALILATIVPVLMGLPMPFAPVQIIVLELLMDLGASVSFVAEPVEGDIMRRPPRNPRARFLDRAMGAMIGGGGISLGLAVIAAYAWARWPADLSASQATTVAFASWLVGHVLLAINFRSEREPLSRLGLLSNPIALAWMAASIGLAVLAAAVPPLHNVLRTASIPTEAWIAVVLAPMATLWWIEVVKVLRWRRSPVGE